MFFHISKIDLGNTVTLTPRLPDSAVTKIEGNQKRICVSTSPLFCLRSISGTRQPKISDILYELQDSNLKKCYSPVLYYTKEIPIIPPDVSDFRHNQEHWFIEETEFYKIGFIDLVLLTNNIFGVSSIKHDIKLLSKYKKIEFNVDDMNKKVIEHLYKYII